MPSRFFYRNSLDRSVTSKRGVWLVFIITMVYRNSCTYANSVDPDQTPLSAASDLGLHCLPMSLLRYARHKWVERERGGAGKAFTASQTL